MIRIVPFEQLSAGQRDDAATILTRAFAHQPAAWPTLEEARDEVARALDDPDRSALAAIDGQTVLGWIGLIRTYSHAFELHPLAVDPTWQRQGIGAQLVRALEDLARQQGGVALYLGADDDFGGTSLFGADPFPDLLASLAAVEAQGERHPLGFYRKLGFTLSGIVPDANGPGAPDILLAKRI